MAAFDPNDHVVYSTMEEVDDLPRLKRFGNLVLNLGSSSSDESTDAQTIIAPSQASYREDVKHQPYGDSYPGLDISAPEISSLPARIGTPRPPVPSDDHHLADASDASSFYDGHYKSNAFSFSRGRQVAQKPCSNDASEGTLDERYDADDELSTVQMEATTLELPTADLFRRKITDKLLKMMFVSGETAEPSIETTTVIEDITREQVLEIVRSSTSHSLH